MVPVLTLLAVLAAAAGSLPSAPNFAVDAATMTTTETCTTLVDKDAPLYTALSVLNMGGSDGEMSLDQVVAPIDAAMPWLSKCIGSADILAVGMSALSDPSLSKCISLITSLSSNSSSSSASSQELGSLATASLSGDIFGTTVCPLLNSTVMPCLDTIYTKTLPALLASGGSCCDDMETEMKQALGEQPEEVLKSMTRRVGDMLCAVRSYKDASTGESKNETCGQAWIETLGTGPFMDDLFKMAQIPNNEACAAMEGEKFTTTSGEEYQFFKNQTPIDSCFAPVNLMLTDMSKLPMVAAMNMTDLFADGKCLKGQAVIDWAKDPNGTVLQIASSVDEMIETTMPNLVPNSTGSSSSSGKVAAEVDSGIQELEKQLAGVCFHLPNSVSGCKYTSSITFAFFTGASQQPTSDGNPATPEALTSAAVAISFPILSTIIALALVGIFEV